MIILSLSERTTLAVEEQLSENCADLIEIRLDALETISIKDIQRLLKKRSLLMTLRSKDEGGEREYSLAKRHQILKEVIDLKPQYLDLEYARDQRLIAYVKETSPSTKIILSYHHLKGVMKDVEEKLIQMKNFSVWKCKIATPSESILDALKMLLLIKKHPHFIGISMGEKGMLTRLLGPLFNQPFTYASTDKKKTALGQFTIKELTEFYRYRAYNEKTKLLGLVGNPLSQSPGSKIYNTIFCREKLNALYLNFEIEEGELETFIAYAKELHFFGLSITIPFKEKIVPLLDVKDPEQQGIASINTILFQKESLYGVNTDGLGALDMLRQKEEMLNKKVLIVGAGGTAYGIGYVFQKAGSKITIMNRTNSKAKALAKKLKASFKPFEELEHLKESDYDILVHTTPVGNKNANDCLIPESVIYPKKTILDVVFNESRLLKLGRERNCITYSGKEFWVWQASLQCKLWFKEAAESFKMKLKKHMP